MYNDHGVRSTIDPAYPNRTRFIDEPGRMGSNEILPLHIDAQVELIARSSYLLGASQMDARNAQIEAYGLKRELEETKAKLDSANSDRDHYKRRATALDTRVDEQNATLKRKDAEITRLKNKINPPKPAVKKAIK